MADTVAEMLVRVGADVSDFSKGIGGAADLMDQMGKRMTAAGVTLSAAITAPLVGIGVASLHMAGEFQASMNKVSALGEITGESLKKLQGFALELGAKTKYSAKEAADGMAELAAQGFKTEQIFQAMPGVLDLAAAAGVSVAQASKAVAEGLGQWNLKASDTAMLTDLMSKAAASGSLSLSDLQTTFKYIGPVATAAGQGLQEMTAAIVLLSNAGIKGSDAGTALRAGLVRLLDPPKAAAAAMDQLGISVKDAAGKMLPLNAIIDQFVKSGATIEQISAIVGKNAVGAWAALAQQGGAALRTMTTEMDNANGATKRMADTMNGGITGAFERMKGSIETAGIAIGLALGPAAEKLAGFIEQIVNYIPGVVAAFTSLPVPLQAFALALVAAAAAVGPLLAGLGLMAQGASSIMNLFAAIKGTEAGFQALISGASAVRGIATAFASFTGISAVIESVVAGISGLGASIASVAAGMSATGIGAVIVGVAVALTGLVTGIKFATEHWDALKNVMSAFVTDIGNLFGGLGTIISNALSSVGTFISGAAASLFEPVKGAWDVFVDWFMTSTGGIGPAIVGAFSGVGSAISNAFSGIADFVKGAFGGVFDVIKSVASGIVDYFEHFWQNMVNHANFFAQAMKSIMPETAAAMQKFADEVNRGVPAMKGMETATTGFATAQKSAAVATGEHTAKLPAHGAALAQVKPQVEGHAKATQELSVASELARIAQERHNKSIKDAAVEIANTQQKLGDYYRVLTQGAPDFDPRTGGKNIKQDPTLPGTFQVPGQADILRNVPRGPNDVMDLPLRQTGMLNLPMNPAELQQWEEQQKKIEQTQRAMQALEDTLGAVFTHVGDALTDLIMHGGKFADVMLAGLDDIAKKAVDVFAGIAKDAVMGWVNKTLLGPDGALGGIHILGKSLSDLFGTGASAASQAASAATGAAKSLGGAAASGTSTVTDLSGVFNQMGGGAGTASSMARAGSSAASAGGGMMGAVDPISGAVSAGASVATAILTAKLEGTMNQVERNTAAASIHLMHILETANQYWPVLEGIRDVWYIYIEAFRSLMGTIEGLRDVAQPYYTQALAGLTNTGGGGTFYITVENVRDVADIDYLVAQLEERGYIHGAA
jgi:TP901 family phage tail tape measure protein